MKLNKKIIISVIIGIVCVCGGLYYFKNRTILGSNVANKNISTEKQSNTAEKDTSDNKNNQKKQEDKKSENKKVGTKKEETNKMELPDNVNMNSNSDKEDAYPYQLSGGQ